jgi:hypothetical protein
MGELGEVLGGVRERGGGGEGEAGSGGEIGGGTVGGVSGSGRALIAAGCCRVIFLQGFQ